MNEEYLLQIALELRDEASRNIAQANQEMERMKAQMKSLEEGAKKTSDSMKVSFEKVAKASKVMLAGITGVAVASVKTYADMEKGIKKVETVSSKSFEQIKSSATELATTYGISISEVLQGNYDMVSSMGDIAQSQEVLSTAAKLSVAGFTSFGGAINALSSVMNAYKMEASEATKVSDMLMQVQNRGVVDINELQAVLSSVVPAAAAMKIEFKDVAAAIATMTSNKIPAAQATTQLKAAFAELAKEGTTVSKNFKEITGVSFQTFIAQGGTVAEAFDLIARGAETSGKSLFDVFGSIDAAGAVINLTGANADKFSNNLKGMEEAAGTTQKGFEKMSESFSFQIEVLKERALVGARSIGEQLTPKVRELVEWISKIDWKVAFSQENINSAITWGKTIAGIAGTLWAIEKALWAAKVAQTAWNIACLANPYIVAGLAIVGVVGGVTTALVKGANDAKKVANDSAEAQIAALERVKASMAKGGTGASELDFVNGFTELKDVLNSGDIQKGIAQVDKELKKLKGVKIQLTPEEEMEYLNKGYATTLKKNSVNKSPVITPNFGGGSGGGTGGGLGGSVASSAR
ncbi:MAG: phage tail tape measure protein, partial [Anaerovoracaceae bacterium]